MPSCSSPSLSRLLVAYGISALFPLGALGVFEPNPGPLLDGSVVLVGVAGLLLAALGGAWLSNRGVPPRSRPTSAALGRRVLPTGTGLSVGLGTRLAIVGPSGARRSVASLLLGVVGIAALLASVIVALNVDAIGGTPARWGVNYDRLLGNPFVETDHDIVTPVQRERAVTRLTAGHLGSLTIDGHETPSIAIEPVKGSLLPTVLDGRAPTGPNDIALGAEIARSLDTKVGDRVTVQGSRRSTRSFRVVGTVVTPDSAGAGAVVTFRAYRSLNPDATRNVLFADFSPRAPDRRVHRIVTANFTPPDAMPTPTSIQALRRVLPASVLLAIVLSLLLLVSCAFLLTISVRAQRRDLAILHAGAGSGASTAARHAALGGNGLRADRPACLASRLDLFWVVGSLRSSPKPLALCRTSSCTRSCSYS